MTLTIIGAIVGLLASLAGALVMYTKIVRHLTNIESTVNRIAPMASHVPNIYYRIAHIEDHLGIAPPEVPVFVNGKQHDS